jgi:hypothetical protein
LLLRMVVGVVAFVVGRGAGVGSSRAGGSHLVSQQSSAWALWFSSVQLPLV